MTVRYKNRQERKRVREGDTTVPEPVAPDPQKGPIVVKPKKKKKAKKKKE